MKKSLGFAAAIVVTVPGAFVLSSRAAGPLTTSCLVTTTSGDIQGVDNGSSCAFLGIPFAAPPVGDLRWKPPQPAAVWAPAMLNAIAAPPNCPSFNLAGATIGNEDCLKLNIWTPDPAPASPAPVIVWIHTGAFQATSANFPANNGRRLAELTGAVVVAANYRLGPFGFMAHAALTSENAAYRSSGNYGFLDQRAALAWVRDNISAFGGDPGDVAIGGQSAGAHSVGLHVVSPRSAGYFDRAILHSGYASSRWRTLADAESVGSAFAAALGCTDPAQVLACMRGTTRDQVLLALPSIPGGQQRFAETPGIPWGPVVDGLEIPDQPRRLLESGTFNQVPVIIGSTRDEGWVFVDRSFPGGLTPQQYHAAVETEFGVADAPAILAMYPAEGFASPKHALARLTGDAEYVCEARRVARLVARTRTPVYEYSFEREVDAVAPDLVIHGLDTNFLFGNNFGPPAPYILSAEDLALSASMSGYWTRFMATGNPNVSRRARRGDLDALAPGDGGDLEGDDGVVHWPRFGRHGGKRRADEYLVLDVPVREGARLRAEQCDFWQPFFLQSIVGSQPATAPSNDLCGVTVVSDLKLDHDVACAGNGLVVGADRIRLDLNGHSITGAGGSVGITVTGRTGVSIVGGIVKNFEAGVRTAEASGIVIRANEFLGNTDGVDLQLSSTGNTVSDNAFRGNRSRGIMLRTGAIENVIKDNTFSGNRVGILLFGGIDTLVKDNFVSESVLAGIRLNVGVSGNRIVKNTVVSNPAGIDFIVTAAGSAIGNILARNTIAMNACGVQGPVAGNTLKRNIYQGNGADSCP